MEHRSPQEDAAKSGGAADNLKSAYLRECERAERLLFSGRPAEAARVFDSALATLPNAPRYERAVVLGRLGYCFHLSGRQDLATARLREALNMAGQLAPSEGVKRLLGVLHAQAGEVLHAQDHQEARKNYEAAIAIAQELNDPRSQGINQVQLGSLALTGGRHEEALLRGRAAIGLLQEVRQPGLEALAWEHLGHVFHAQHQLAEAEQYYCKAAELREAAGDAVGAAQLWSRLGALGDEMGRPEQAELWYRKAIASIRLSRDLVQLGRILIQLAFVLRSRPALLAEARSLAEQVIAHGHVSESTGVEFWAIFGVLADIAEKEFMSGGDGRQTAALRSKASSWRQLQHYAPQILSALSNLGEEPSCARALLLARIGRCFQMAGRPELAIAKLKEAIATVDQAASERDRSLHRMLQVELGNVLCGIGQYAEAGKICAEALTTAQQVRDLRGQGVDHVQLGSLARAEGRLEQALTHYRSALELFRDIDDPFLEAVACEQLGGIMHAQGARDEAESQFRRAAELRESAGDLAGAQHLRSRSAGFSHEAGLEQSVSGDPNISQLEPSSPESASGQRIELTLREELAIEYAFEPDLLIDGPREFRSQSWKPQASLASDEIRPILMPCTRVFVDGNGAIHFAPPPAEPDVERQPGCTVMRRKRIEMIVSNEAGLVWRLLRKMDGSISVAVLVAGLSAEERSTTTQLIADLAAAGVIDTSGRPFGRFLHTATKKGVLPAGGLEGKQVQDLATDGTYRTYPEAPRIDLNPAVPAQLHDFHILTHRRRSRRDYEGSLTRAELEAVLHSACGVTGTVSWGGREAKLRAYPSSGALYAVEIYPLALSVEGLDPAVYHYRATEHVLELVRPVERSAIVGAMLPMERQMVAGAAAMICLTGNFPRHERKYGEGGYRMLVAEAGHVSQSLVLASTALGLAARPFGGVFDNLINQELGVEIEREEFLLAVLVGRSRGSALEPIESPA